MLVVVYKPPQSLKIPYSLEEHQCKPPPQDRLGEMHSLHQIDATASQDGM